MINYSKTYDTQTERRPKNSLMMLNKTSRLLIITNWNTLMGRDTTGIEFSRQPRPGDKKQLFNSWKIKFAKYWYSKIITV